MTTKYFNKQNMQLNLTSGLGEVQAVGLKSLAESQQSVHYCHQLPSRLCDEHTQ
jgi:hypothetical protein